MPGQRPDGGAGPAPATAQEPFEELERRVVAMAEALREARKARRAAESDANVLREQVRERDLQIVLLKKQVEGDDLRTSVRTRVESLISRIDELEREG